MLEGYYSEIDYLPLDCWIKANSGQYNALRENKTVGNDKNDIKAWELVFNDYLKKIGLSEDYKDYLDLIILYNEKAIRYLDNRERYLLNELNELNKKIESLKKLFSNENENTIHESINAISKMQGYQLKINDITTLQYFLLLKKLSNGKGL